MNYKSHKILCIANPIKLRSERETIIPRTTLLPVFLICTAYACVCVHAFGGFLYRFPRSCEKKYRKVIRSRVVFVSISGAQHVFNVHNNNCVYLPSKILCTRPRGGCHRAPSDFFSADRFPKYYIVSFYPNYKNCKRAIDYSDARVLYYRCTYYK